MELTKEISQTKIIKSFTVAIILGSIALTISAKIKIPFYPVPMTMQTFVVLFLGVSLGYKIGLASVGPIFTRRNCWITCFFKLSRKRCWFNLFYRSYDGIFNWFFN